MHPVKRPDTIGTGNRPLGVTDMVAITLTALAGYAAGVASYALIAAWIIRPRPRRAK